MINYTGISESRAAPIAARIAAENTQTLIIVSTDVRAGRLAEDLAFFTDKKIITLYGEENLFFRYDTKNRDVLIRKLSALKALGEGEPVIIISPVSAAIKHLPPQSSTEKHELRLSVGEETDFSLIAEKLTMLGYERYGIVEGRGQFSIRGGIIDVFTPDSENPYRIEFFGNEVDSIRKFEPQSQRSVKNISSVSIYPANEIVGSESFYLKGIENIKTEYTKYADSLKKKSEKLLKETGGKDEDGTAELLEIAAENVIKTRDEFAERVLSFGNMTIGDIHLGYFYDSTEYLWDYIKDGGIIIDDPDRIYELLELKDSEAEADFETMLSRGQVVPRDIEMISGTKDFMKVFSSANSVKDIAIFTPIPKKIRGVDGLDKIYNVNSRQPLSFNGKMNVFEAELKAYLKKGYEVNLLLCSREKLDNIREFVERSDELLPHLEKINFRIGNLTQGIDYPDEKRVWISENDIFARKKTSKRRRYGDKGKSLVSFSDLHEGDYVVHEYHGIGRFEGINQLSIEGKIRDYIKIKYAGQDMLYVPVEQMDIVRKYIGGDDSVPKINKLSGGEWKLTKSKAKAAINEMAGELIELYAKRASSSGYPFGKDTVWQKEFEDSFPFTETDDQLRAAEEIKADMERPLVMDRLLLGDVGFGKTEVAARAIFKCLADGKQAAMLVPTTILANQHYYTLKERFESFPVKVDVLSRFKTKKQQDKIIENLAIGSVDFVVGTHRLLSKDVKFKDLGLLVVDEEQRFGVDDKETIKKYKANVDVLTLSATPIPRTLNMSLTGIKDMSIIEEPPEERYPVQTYVLEQDDELIRDVIEREIGRGGQVFVIYNRVAGISQIAEKLENMMPDVRFAVGHGQMSERQLENVMLDFINGETDVLIATTIVESGLDIPNANTMIILDSDRYGLSQLYQLRGRVGRSNRLSYCYLMYKRDKVLSETAEKRLKAIREFTEFGAGFKVAMKDLEIRGAGNMLGTAQSGHMMNIGYDLYCKMVDNAIRNLKGETVSEDREETKIEINVSAYIPSSYISDEAQKLDMYRRISAVKSAEDEAEIIDELIDRFGDVPKETMNLLKVAYIRYLAEELGVSRIHRLKADIGPAVLNSKKNKTPEASYYILNFFDKHSITPKGVLGLYDKLGQNIHLYNGIKPYLRLKTTDLAMLTDIIGMLEILYENRDDI